MCNLTVNMVHRKNMEDEQVFVKLKAPQKGSLKCIQKLKGVFKKP